MLVAKSGKELQRLLDLTHDYLVEKKLISNVDKSAVVVFGEKGGQSEIFYVNGSELKIEKEFVYLGCKVTSKGRWSSHVDLME